MRKTSVTYQSNRPGNGNRSPSRRSLPLAALLVISLISAVGISRADVYRYIDADGVECYSDCPQKKGAVRIMKDRKNSAAPFPTVKTRRSPPLVETVKPVTNQKDESNKIPLSNMALPVRGRITSTVGMRHDPFDGLLRFHNGIDIAIPEGTPVKPVAPGTVNFSGLSNGYGNMVVIAHDDGMITIYGHNSLNLVKKGERIGTDTSIALSGSTGRSTGPHLHFEAWKNGVNLSKLFLDVMPAGEITMAGIYHRKDIIRRSIQADGSLLFTNLP
jgi:murein DD-endopeptidase MepM/ murein hydrolase activator NlpD